jgi:NADH-quinone oxidoreductase subunit L
VLTPGIPAIVRYLWLIPALPIVAAGVGALLKQSRRKFAAAIAIASMTVSLMCDCLCLRAAAAGAALLQL